MMISDVVRDIIPQPTVDLTLARQKVGQAQLSDRGHGLAAGIAAGVSHAGGARVGKRNFTFLLMARPGWAGGRRNRAAEIRKLFDQHKTDIAGHIVLVGDQDTQNLAVSQVRLATELPTVNRALRV